MPTPAYTDPGTFNLRDVDTGSLVGKIHVEAPNADISGGRGYPVHYALFKSSPGEEGWGVYVRPTQATAKSYKWEGTGESLSTFLGWMHDSARKSKLRYVCTGVREQDTVP